LVLPSPERKAVLQVAVEDVIRRMTPRDFLQARIKSKSVRLGEDIQPAGLAGYSAVVESGASSSRRVERLSVVYHKDHAYLFSGASKKPEEFARYDADFTAVVASFHPLSAEEQGLAGALRIRLQNAQEGVGLAELARLSPLQSHAEEQLRLLNQLYPDGIPTPGAVLKFIQ
jgi:predicted Zn-dependent protease